MKRSDWRILLQLKLYTKQNNINTEHVVLMPFNGSLQFLLKRVTKCVHFFALVVDVCRPRAHTKVYTF